MSSEKPQRRPLPIGGVLTSDASFAKQVRVLALPVTSEGANESSVPGTIVVAVPTDAARVGCRC